MDRTLFVLIGAGASYDSTSPEYADGASALSSGWLDDTHDSIGVLHEELRPPLVTQLFEPRFAAILNRYPLAQMAASDIRSRAGSSVAIEQFLRERYRDSTHDLDRRKFHAVHFYLQDLLWTISRTYTKHPDNYDRLITATERLPRVVYVSLNYDTLFDDRLRVAAPSSLGDLAGYCSRTRSWSLVKPHGSVDWGRRISPTPEWSRNGAQLVISPPAEIVLNEVEFALRRRDNLRAVREDRGAQGNIWYYPALSAPLGSPDDFSCPPSHIDFLRAEIEQQDQLDILMLGYSGLDDEVLKLFAQSGKKLGHVKAVSSGYEESSKATLRLWQAVQGSTAGGAAVPVQETFSEFVTGPGLGEYLVSRNLPSLPLVCTELMRHSFIHTNLDWDASIGDWADGEFELGEVEERPWQRWPRRQLRDLGPNGGGVSSASACDVQSAIGSNVNGQAALKRVYILGSQNHANAVPFASFGLMRRQPGDGRLAASYGVCKSFDVAMI